VLDFFWRGGGGEGEGGGICLQLKYLKIHHLWVKRLIVHSSKTAHMISISVLYQVISSNMKPLSEVAPLLLVIQIETQAVSCIIMSLPK
jgi:hypothetical protein